MQSFISELGKFLENSFNNKIQMPIIEDILSKNNLTTGNENAIRDNINDIILEYAKKNFKSETMYFVQDSKKTYWKNNERQYDNSVYSVLKVENNQIEQIEIDKKNMPKDIGVNDVFTIKENEYVINTVATEELLKEIETMANKIIDKQNANLASYRKEGHLYMVSEEIGDNRFLYDLTDKSNVEFEEVDMPKDILDKATEGAVLKYTNGTYEYYSNDGFERLDKIN